MTAPDWLSDMEDRMATLASRLADDDPAERRYAARWLDHLWRIHEAATE